MAIKQLERAARNLVEYGYRFNTDSEMLAICRNKLGKDISAKELPELRRLVKRVRAGH